MVCCLRKILIDRLVLSIKRIKFCPPKIEMETPLLSLLQRDDLLTGQILLSKRKKFIYFHNIIMLYRKNRNTDVNALGAALDLH